EEVCALRFAFDQSQLQAEQSCEAQAALVVEIDGLRRDAAAHERDEGLALRLAESEQGQQAAELKGAALQSSVLDLQEQLLREQSHAATLWNDLQSQTQFREALDSALAEARARCAELESALEEERQRRDEQSAEARAATELSARNEDLEARLAGAV